MRQKKCPKCEKVKDETEFYGRNSRYLSSYCILCSSAHSSEIYYQDVETSRAKGRAVYSKRKDKQEVYRVKVRYGLTPEKVQEMLMKQNGRCANTGCLAVLTKKRGPDMMHIDHCHQTQKVRGLLCNNCNVALGVLNDSPAKIIGIIEYLSKSSPIRIAA